MQRSGLSERKRPISFSRYYPFAARMLAADIVAPKHIKGLGVFAATSRVSTPSSQSSLLRASVILR
jgi:hypothetical protein